MQIDGVAGQVYAHEIAHVDAHALLRTNDMHVVFLYREIKLVGLVEDPGAQDVVGTRLIFDTLCHSRHIVLQFEVAVIDGSEHGGESQQCRQNGGGGHHAPAGNMAHCWPSDSLLAAQSSSHVSPECGVHRGFSSPEICSSS